MQIMRCHSYWTQLLRIIVILGSLVINANSESMLVRQNSNSSFSCVVVDQNINTTFLWSRVNGEPLSSRTHGSNSSVLTIVGVREEDEGEYTCTASTENETLIATILLTVYDVPVIHQLRPEHVTEVFNQLLLTCTAQNDPDSPHPLEITWYKGDTQLTNGQDGRYQITYIHRPDNVTIALLTVSRVQKDDEGQYSCRVRPGDVSTETTVVVNYVPEIITFQILPSSNVTIGEIVRLSCHVDASPLPSVTLYRNNREVYTTTRTVVDYQIQQVSADDDGTVFSCGAQNSLGTASQQHATLTVTGIPNVVPSTTTVSPSSSFIIYHSIGSSNILPSVVATSVSTTPTSHPAAVPANVQQTSRGLTSVQIRWTASEEHILFYARLSCVAPCTSEDVRNFETMDTSLTLYGLKPGHVYTVQIAAVTDDGVRSEYSDPIQVSIAPTSVHPPRIIAHPVSKAVELYTSNSSVNISFSCNAAGNSSRFQWERLQEVLPVNSQGDTTDTLILYNVQPKDSGFYRCSINDDSLTAYSEYAALNITVYPPNITAAYLNQSLYGTGDQAVFMCKGEGFGRLHFKWQRQSGNISPSAVVDVNTGILTIPDLSSSDKGNYRCIISDEWNGTVYSEYVQLNVSEENDSITDERIGLPYIIATTVILLIIICCIIIIFVVCILRHKRQQCLNSDQSKNHHIDELDDDAAYEVMNMKDQDNSDGKFDCNVLVKNNVNNGISTTTGNNSTQHSTNDVKTLSNHEALDLAIMAHHTTVSSDVKMIPLQKNPAYGISLKDQCTTISNVETLKFQRDPAYCTLLSDHYTTTSSDETITLQKNPAYGISLKDQYASASCDEIIKLQGDPAYGTRLGDQNINASRIKMQGDPASGIPLSTTASSDETQKNLAYGIPLKDQYTTTSSSETIKSQGDTAISDETIELQKNPAYDISLKDQNATVSSDETIKLQEDPSLGGQNATPCSDKTTKFQGDPAYSIPHTGQHSNETIILQGDPALQYSTHWPALQRNSSYTAIDDITSEIHLDYELPLQVTT